MADENEDKTYYNRVDAVINLLNEQAGVDTPPGFVSASAMFALARYCAFVSAADFEKVADYKTEREEIVRYFTEDFRRLLNENIDDYTENFDNYFA